MRVLVACEFSGVVRDAFRARGHDAWSCDLLPSETSEGGYHLEGDVRHWLTPQPMIAHPPCTYLANSGVRWLYRGGKGTERDPDRWALMEEAVAFYRTLWEAPIPKKCLENPVMHRHASALLADLPQPQYVQPWWFGHGETKATGLRLQNLPPLLPTNRVNGRAPRVHYASPSPDRWKERSRTLPGIAAAMAAQWG